MAQTLTGALAVVKSGGRTIGKLRNITITEDIVRTNVQGMGRLTDTEKPATKINCRLTAEQYFIDFNRSKIPNAIRRDAATSRQLEEQIMLDSSIGVQIDLFKTVQDAVDPATGLMSSKATPIAVVPGCMITSEGINVAEGQVAGQNISFEYFNPILTSATDGA